MSARLELASPWLASIHGEIDFWRDSARLRVNRAGLPALDPQCGSLLPDPTNWGKGPAATQFLETEWRCYMAKFLFRGIILLVAGLAPAVASAQQQEFQYVVKFVCGKGDGQVVAPGNYFTAINVHNPTTAAVTFRKKIAVALPSEKAGPISPIFRATLKPDEALEIDCPDILKHAHSDASFLKGFVVIKTNRRLDIVAVYTAAGSTGAVETMFLERVQPSP